MDNKWILTEQEYGEYYENYIGQVSSEGPIEQMKKNTIVMRNLLGGMNEIDWNYTYEKGKWSVAELLLHVLDTERIFMHRALRFSRQDSTPLPGYDHDGYIVNFRGSKSMEALTQQYFDTRATTLSFFKSSTNEELNFIGEASNLPLSARAVAWIIAGHEVHHVNVLKQRYFNK